MSKVSYARSEAISPTAFLIPWLIFLSLMLLVGWRASIIHTDFRSFYAAGYLIRTSPSHLYDLPEQMRVQNALISHGSVSLPYFHPSYEALIYAPFSLLNYKAAYLSFQCFNSALLLLTFYCCRSVFSTPRAGLLLLFTPLLIATFQGQNSILLLLLCSLAWMQVVKGNKVTAGIILALALFKFQIVLPIALILIIVRHGRRFAAGFSVAAALVSLLSVVLVGWHATTSLAHLLHGGSLEADQGSAIQHAMAIYPLAMPNLNGLLYAAGTRLLQPQFAFLLLGIASLCLLSWCAFTARRTSVEAIAFSIAVLCGLLISNHLYMHDATLLLLPMALVGAAHKRIVAALYTVPPLLLLTGLGDKLFWFALPILALLLEISRRNFSVSENTCSRVTPLPL